MTIEPPPPRTPPGLPSFLSRCHRETHLAFAPRGSKSFSMAIPIWLREKLFQKNWLTTELRKLAPDYDNVNR